MRITRAADFAVRILLFLARHKSETSKVIAQKMNIPFNYLTKLVQILAKKRFIHSRKGKGGGLALALSPRKITLLKVIEAIEGPILLSECIFSKEVCCFGTKCKTRRCLSLVQNKLRRTLSQSSIYDLL